MIRCWIYQKNAKSVFGFGNADLNFPQKIASKRNLVTSLLVTKKPEGTGYEIALALTKLLLTSFDFSSLRSLNPSIWTNSWISNEIPNHLCPGGMIRQVVVILCCNLLDQRKLGAWNAGKIVMLVVIPNVESCLLYTSDAADE